MEVDIITRKDLEAFGDRLLSGLLKNIKDILEPHKNTNMDWMRSAEVRGVLKLSPSSLQNLRVHGKLNPVKIGGAYYYKRVEVYALFEQNN